MKDTATGKRVSRPNPESQWIRKDFPHLRIVDDELWNAARARQKQISAIFVRQGLIVEEHRREADDLRREYTRHPKSLLYGMPLLPKPMGRGTLDADERGTSET